MDPALVRQREAFKKRALAVPVVETKPSESKRESSKERPAKQPKQKKKKSKFSRPKPQPLPENVDQIKQAALSAHRNNNPYRVLKAVVDMMRQRYTSKNYEKLTLEEILTEISLTDLRTDTRQWLHEALKGNAKIAHYPSPGEDLFLFRPALGLDVRSRKQLLEKLMEYERKGLGGVLMSEVKEALHNPEKAVKRLEDENEVIKIVRQDKEEVLFYNNSDYEICVDEDFRSLWRGVSLDGLAEGDIERYLQNVGLGAMQGETRKRKAPSSQQKKARKKTRTAKVLNTHLASDLLKDYSEGAFTGK